MIKLRYCFIMILTAFVCLYISGCKTTGYTIRIETESVKYSEIPKIENILLKRGYKQEKTRDEGVSSNEVRTSIIKEFSRDKVIQDSDPKNVKEYFEKTYNEERYWFVRINLSYVKDVSNNKILNVKIDIYNQFIGGISPVIKTEIDNVGDLIYQKIVDQVGKENVRIKREEWGPPFLL